MNDHPADPPLVPPLSVTARVTRSVLSCMALAIVTFGLWATIQFIVAAQVSDQTQSETVGLSTLIFAPLGAAVAGITGLVVGAVSRKGKLRWNLLWTQLIFLAICAGIVAWIVLDSQPK